MDQTERANRDARRAHDAAKIAGIKPFVDALVAAGWTVAVRTHEGQIVRMVRGTQRATVSCRGIYPTAYRTTGNMVHLSTAPDAYGLTPDALVAWLAVGG